MHGGHKDCLPLSKPWSGGKVPKNNKICYYLPPSPLSLSLTCTDAANVSAAIIILIAKVITIAVLR